MTDLRDGWAEMRDVSRGNSDWEGRLAEMVV